LSLLSFCNPQPKNPFPRLNISKKSLYRLLQRNARRLLVSPPKPVRVPIANLLCGGENLIPAAQYALITGKPLRPSTPVSQGPHAALLREYALEGEKLLSPGRFEQTAYYRNASECLDLVGLYFPYVKETHQIVKIAERFIRQFVKNEPVPDLPGHNKPNEPIDVRPIRLSDCFEVINGNHRIAAAIYHGDKFIEVLPRQEAVLTPMQELLRNVLWQDGRIELYQPVGLPEVQNWTLVRHCSDRFALMRDFLQARQLLMGTYVDLGASYGWFVAQMRALGFQSYGVERDPMALRVGELLYDNNKDFLIRSELVRYLRENNRKFDVVSCFSVAHHFALGRAGITAEELMGMIDRITEKVLFFDTGQCHEEWFKESLKEWDADFIEKWLYKNTTFKKVLRLGTDCDSVKPFEQNYRRTLFACIRE
jgi:hypothetical protein